MRVSTGSHAMAVLTRGRRSGLCMSRTEVSLILFQFRIVSVVETARRIACDNSPVP